jgi:hypothetical protein
MSIPISILIIREIKPLENKGIESQLANLQAKKKIMRKYIFEQMNYAWKNAYSL